MITTAQQDFFRIVNERHAVKQFDPNVVMTEQEIKELIEATSKAPSSWNLQHWKFLVINNQATKEKLLPIAYNQQQIAQSSAVIAILGDLEANKNAEPIFGGAVKAGMMLEEVKNALISQIEGAYQSKQVARDEAIRNASLAAMQLMLAAKAMGYDTCPMGGYNVEQFIKAFDVSERYLPIMLIAVGKAAEPARPSARFAAEDLIFWNGMK